MESRNFAAPIRESPLKVIGQAGTDRSTAVIMVTGASLNGNKSGKIVSEKSQR